MAMVRYLVDDVDRAVKFYTTVLGFSPGERWGKAFATVALGDVTLWLSGPEAPPRGRCPTGGSPPREDGTAWWSRCRISSPR